MKKQLYYVHEAIALFSPETGLDYTTAAGLLWYRLEKSPGWRQGLLGELTALRSVHATDWIAIIDNSEFCMGEFESQEGARLFVETLLEPFLRPRGDDPVSGADDSVSGSTDDSEDSVPGS